MGSSNLVSPFTSSLGVGRPKAERKLLVSDIFEIYLQSQEEEVLENISMIFYEVIQTLQQSDKNPGKFFESVAEEIYRTERI